MAIKKDKKFKDIPGYEGIYGISKSGIVVRYEKFKGTKINGVFAFHKEKILKQSTARGYKKVELWKNLKRKIVAVHRMVYMTYRGEIDKDLQVNHIDGNKSNNHISNLELCTSKENIRHGWKIGLFKGRNGEDNPAVKLKLKDVLKIRKMYDTKKFFYRELAKLFNVSESNIAKIITKENWKDNKKTYGN